MVAERLDRALRAAGIPIVSVSIGSDGDRSTWAIRYDLSATAQHRIDGEALRVSFDPQSAAAVQAEAGAHADGDAMRVELKAWLLFYLRDKLGRNPTLQERNAAIAALRQAYIDVS